MKNIETILKEFGLEIPEDKKKMFADSFNAEYKTIADYTKQVEKISKLTKELEEKNSNMADLNSKIKELNDGTGKLQELEEKVKQYEEAETKRIETERALKIENEIKARFDKVTADKKFKHEFIKSGVYDVFKKALADESNKAKGDSEIYAQLEKDNDWYENPQDPVQIKSTGNTGQKEVKAFPNFF